MKLQQSGFSAHGARHEVSFGRGKPRFACGPIRKSTKALSVRLEGTDRSEVYTGIESHSDGVSGIRATVDVATRLVGSGVRYGKVLWQDVRLRNDSQIAGHPIGKGSTEHVRAGRVMPELVDVSYCCPLRGVDVSGRQPIARTKRLCQVRMQRYEVESVAVARPGKIVVDRCGIGIAVKDRNDHGHLISLGRWERLVAKEVYRSRPGTASATTIEEAVDSY